MSVINDMLRDLEQRNAPERNVISPASVNHLIEPNNSDWKGKWIVVSLVIIAGLGFGAWMFPNTVEQKSTALANNPEAANLEYKTAENVAPKNREIDLPKVIEKRDTTPKPLLVSNKSSSQKLVAESLTVESIAALKPTAAGIQGAHEASAYEQEIGAVKQKSQEMASEQIFAKQAPLEQMSVDQLLVKQTLAKQKTSMKKHPVLPPEVLDQNNAEQALVLFNENQARQAYRQLYDFIAGNSIDSKSRLVLASYLLEDGRLQEAGDVLVRASIEQDPDMRQIKARWLLASNKPNMALHTLISDLPILDKFPDYYALLASYYQQFGYPEKAAETYSMLVQFDANAADWWAGLGVALDSAKQYANAELAYQRALKLPGLNSQLVDFMKNRLQIFGA